MKSVNHRLIKLEQQINGNESERIIATLGDETVIFKNADEMRKAFVETFNAEELAKYNKMDNE
jgi:hypothetical protein